METFLRVPRQREPISMVFREERKRRRRRKEGGESIGSQNFQIYRSIYGGGSPTALIASPGKFGPRDVASRFLVSILKTAPATAAACWGVIDLKYGLYFDLTWRVK